MAQATAPMGETTETGDAAGGADHTSPARLALADSLRRLGNALVAHQPDDELLAEIARRVDEVTPGRARPRPSGPTPSCRPGDRSSPGTLPEGTETAGVEERLPRLRGLRAGQPHGRRRPAVAGGRGGGLPGDARRGLRGGPRPGPRRVVAALMDETMGLVMSISSSPAFTGRLTVTYRAPTPLGRPLEARARLHDQLGPQDDRDRRAALRRPAAGPGRGALHHGRPERFFATEYVGPGREWPPPGRG